MKNDELLKAIEELKATIAEATEVIKGLEAKLNEPEPTEFKVNDICRVIHTSGFHSFPMGEVVRFLYKTPAGNLHCIDNRNLEQSVPPSHLEIIFHV